jgi:hypothetical protein
MRFNALAFFPVFSCQLLSVIGALAQTTPASSLLPLTDNAQPPYMGIYEGCAGLGIKGNGLYAAWLHRTNVWGHDTLPFGTGSTWEHVSGKWQDWIYKPWSDWVQAASNRRMVISVPLLPGPADGTGPTTGAAAGKPVSLAEGATGAYNDYFRGLAQTLVAHHLGNSILRLGWEWNGNWYAWKVVTAADAHHFAAYWRQIVDTIRSVPGTQDLKFDWNVSNAFKTAYEPMEAYPGDGYVDYIGDDVYDETWVKSPEYPDGFYPLLPASTEAEIEARHDAAWSQAILSASDWGLAYWQKIADDHRKPLTLPEWGLIWRPAPNNRGGLDDPAFVQRMHDYIQDPAHHVYFASYFDYDGGAEGNSRIFARDGKPVPFPKSTDLYRSLFSLTDAGRPASAPAADSPPR